MAEFVCEVVTEHELCGDVHHYVRRERVTRCRDCVSYRPGGAGHRPRCERSIGTFVPEPDGFCAWGEPREGE